MYINYLYKSTNFFILLYYKINDLHIVTVATESKYYFPYLIESCKRHGKELEVLGYGEKWTGYNMKYRLMIDYLKKLPKDDIVCFVDGYDVLYVRDLNEMKTMFLEIRNSINNKIIIAKDHFSLITYPILLFFGKCNTYSINSGTYIGFVSDLLEIINKNHIDNNKDYEEDQVLIMAHCITLTLCKNELVNISDEVLNELFHRDVLF